MDELMEKNHIWQAMPRNNAVEIAVADEYFDQVLMPLAKEKFIVKYKNIVLPSYYGMILTLGTSWQPLALSIAALNPAKIVVICTKETVPQLEKLVGFLQLSPEQYEYFFVSRSDANAIYQIVRSVHQEWQGLGKVCLDITGGTKAMASSAAMIGALLELDIYYVESKYLPIFRRPEAGSERLEKLPNPKS